jgi:hypothetical protein
MVSKPNPAHQRSSENSDLPRLLHGKVYQVLADTTRKGGRIDSPAEVLLDIYTNSYIHTGFITDDNLVVYSSKAEAFFNTS